MIMEWKHDLDSLVETCALLSKLAYGGGDTQDQLHDSFADSKMYLLKDRCVSVANKDTMFLAFRGTNRHVDGLTNVCFAPRSFGEPYIKVHGGYLLYYKSMREELFSIIRKKSINLQHDIVLTGHSLGGSVAIICAYDLIKHMEKIDRTPQITCITFGTPMTGNDAFCKDFEAHVPQSYHFTCGADITPRIPIPGLGHVEKRVQLPLQTNTFFDKINHHSIETHIAALKTFRPSKLLNKHRTITTQACLRKITPRPVLFLKAMQHLRPIV